MNTKIIIWISGAVLAVIAVAVIWFYWSLDRTTSPTMTGQPTATSSLPIANQVGTTTQQGVPGQQYAVISSAKNEQTVVKDFIHNGATIPDPSNPGNYLLAGNLGSCLSDPEQCQAASADDFSVYYYGAPQSFVITLLKEPIGVSRVHAEQFLLAALGIAKGDLCNLNYRVGVRSFVNEQYAGDNLGFSFCPGATVLPQ